MQTITTRRNTLVARFRDVARGDEDDVLLLDGSHLIADAIGAGLRLRQILVSADALDRPDIRRIVEALAGGDVEIASASSSDCSCPPSRLRARRRGGCSVRTT
jgi:tRNA G18 (ribose-2'-O)-methylase SpoU